MDPEGIEPSTSCMPSRRYTTSPWARQMCVCFFLNFLCIKDLSHLKPDKIPKRLILGWCAEISSTSIGIKGANIKNFLIICVF